MKDQHVNVSNVDPQYSSVDKTKSKEIQKSISERMFGNKEEGSM